MKKSILFVALAALLTVATGCDNTEKTKFPSNLYGYWASQPDAANSWYTLEVNQEPAKQDTTGNSPKRTSPIQPRQAVLTHYADGIKESSDIMELTYYPSNGEGWIRGAGRHLPLQAKNDTVIAISFAGGDVELYRGVKPETPQDQEGSIAGGWKTTSTSDGKAAYLLIYSDKEKDGVAHATFYSDENGMPIGYGATIKTFDTKTKSGTIYVSVDGEEETADFTTDYNTLIIDEEYVYTRQARAKDYALRMEGTWKAGVQGGITLTAEVQQDHSCKMVYEMPPQLAAQIEAQTHMKIPSTGAMYGHTYYSQYAGRGAFEVDSVDIQIDIEGDESEMEDAAGFSVVFEAVSATSVQVPINAKGMKMVLEFKKQ